MKAPNMPPTEDPGLVASSPKGSDLELDALREQIARVIQPACPEVIDGLLAKSKPEMHGRILATWFGPDVFAKADAILSLLAARKGQGEWRGIESARPDPEWSVLGWAPGMDAAVEMVWRADFRGWLTRGGAHLSPTHWQPLPLPPPSKQEE